jgi:hypothetical protein
MFLLRFNSGGGAGSGAQPDLDLPNCDGTARKYFLTKYISPFLDLLSIRFDTFSSILSTGSTAEPARPA